MSITTHTRRAVLAAATAMATAAVGLSLAWPAAGLATGLDPANRLGDLTISPTQGRLSFNGGPSSLTTETGCPEGYRGSSRVMLIWADGAWPQTGYPAEAIASSTSLGFSGSGLTGQPIARGGSYASQWGSTSFNVTATFQGRDEIATYLVTCDPGESVSGAAPAVSAGVGQSKYFSIDLEIQWGDGSAPTWAVYEPPQTGDSAESDLTLDLPEEAIPTQATGLKITVKPGSTALSGPTARIQGQPWQATGRLGEVTVNDDRRDAAAGAWTLNGRASDFVSDADTIAATNLGWAPVKISGAGAAGPAVTPGTGSGLATDQALATGTASATEDVTTVVAADLTLNVPTGTPGGSYKATLTLTLI
ncbi:MAG: hypothetical protein LBD97_09065 [Bifidobacteriaceae bacterium]|jgi:hypothetical protein|nr:hypothetical protein [Bifidobacteriaceae bacterium]